LSERIFNVIFLCTGNSARSILAEAIFNHLGKGRFRAYSAGSRPAGQVNPCALELLARQGIDTTGLRSKSWDEFAMPGAPPIFFIITVCGNAAQETCPVWPGHPANVHWGIPDPAHVEPIEARRAAFEEAFRSLEKRIRVFLALPLETMDRNEIVAAAMDIHDQGDNA